MKYKIYVAIDPGIGGAISFFNSETSKTEVYRTPIKNITKSGKKKKDFDLDSMINLLKRFDPSEVLVLQEATHAMPNNGSVSMYFFGRGAGLWEGIVNALGIKHVLIPPQTWKKYYPELIVPKFKKDPNIEKSVLAKMKSEAKAKAKTRAREMASEMFKDLKDEFKNINSDGKAEAVLMANYLYKNEESILKGKE